MPSPQAGFQLPFNVGAHDGDGAAEDQGQQLIGLGLSSTPGSVPKENRTDWAVQIWGRYSRKLWH